MSDYAIQFQKTGDAQVLEKKEIILEPPAPDEVQVRHQAVGLNFIDVYHRSGLYPVPLPAILGLEASGIVEVVGKDVCDFQKGDRVAYGTGPLGAYSSVRNIPASKISKLPDFIDFKTAAGMMLKGLTTHYLLHSTYPVSSKDTVLFHAAAGGVGLIAGQWLKQIGATVIGTVGSEAKAELAKNAGYDHVILYHQEDIAKRVEEITAGHKVDVVYDSVGQATFEASVNCLKPRGMFVTFGNASGAVPDVAPLTLASKGSLFMTRPTLAHYTQTPEETQKRSESLFHAIQKGLKINIQQEYPLEQASQAHQDLEARLTTGSTLLIP